MVYRSSVDSPHPRSMVASSARCAAYMQLLTLTLNQFASGILLKATYSPTEGCVIVETDSRLLLAGFTYTMCFDFVVLSLTAWKLVINAPRYVNPRLYFFFNDETDAHESAQKSWAAPGSLSSFSAMGWFTSLSLFCPTCLQLWGSIVAFFEHPPY